MLYNVVLVSVVQQSESAISIHISPYHLPLEPPSNDLTCLNHLSSQVAYNLEFIKIFYSSMCFSIKVIFSDLSKENNQLDFMIGKCEIYSNPAILFDSLSVCQRRAGALQISRFYFKLG